MDFVKPIIGMQDYIVVISSTSLDLHNPINGFAKSINGYVDQYLCSLVTHHWIY